MSIIHSMVVATALHAAPSQPSAYRGGAIPEDEQEVNAAPPPPFAVMAADREDESLGLPSTLDWRDRMPPVGTQGACGSCTSFAAVAALEGQLRIACAGTPNLTLSRQFNFSCGGGSCRSGWKLSAAVEFVAEVGVPDEPCLPYAAADGTDVPCSQACSDASTRAVSGISLERPTTGFIHINDIKRALLKGPLVSNMILFEDLQTHTAGVYRHRSGNQLGSHAIVLVGWDDADSAWIARNSWGESFGDRGYFKVAWDDVTLPGRYTWWFDVSRAVASGACSMPR